MFRKIVFSKQADHSADLFHLWYRWYRDVFPADELIITPVKTPASEVDQTIAFYRARGCHIHRLERPAGWRAGQIWDCQREIVQEYLPEEPFLVVSADADQWFEFPTHLPENVSAVPFYRLNVAWDISQPLLADGDFRIGFRHEKHLPLGPAVGGYVNCLDSPHIAVTGHWRGGAPESYVGVEFHVHWYGFNGFLRKVRAASFDATSPGASFHWKAWRQVLEREGEEGLRAVYDQAVARYVHDESRMTPHHRQAAARLKGYLDLLLARDRGTQADR